MAPPNVLDMSQPQPLFVSFHSMSNMRLILTTQIEVIQ